MTVNEAIKSEYIQWLQKGRPYGGFIIPRRR